MKRPLFGRLAQRGVIVAALLLVLAGCSVVRSILPGGRGDKVEFRTSDGFLISGRLFQSESSAKGGVVLAHMRGSNQSAWFDFARGVAGDGYSALTFDFRGYGSSQGRRDTRAIVRDVIAASEFLEEKGASKQVLVGGSMGGTASFAAAADAAADGVIALSAPDRIFGLDAADEASHLAVPMLVVAAIGDKPAAASAEKIYRAGVGSARLHLIRGEDHGTEFLNGTEADEVRKLMKEFLVEILGAKVTGA